MNVDFNAFLKFAAEHNEEMTREIAIRMGNAYSDGITLSQADIQLITEIAVHSNYAVLRQYHEWLNSQH